MLNNSRNIILILTVLTIFVLASCLQNKIFVNTPAKEIIFDKADREKFSHIKSPLDPDVLKPDDSEHLAITMKFSKDSICIDKISKRLGRKYINPIDRGIKTKIFSNDVLEREFWTDFNSEILKESIVSQESKASYVDILVNNDIFFTNFTISIPDLEIDDLVFHLSPDQMERYLKIRTSVTIDVDDVFIAKPKNLPTGRSITNTAMLVSHEAKNELLDNNLEKMVSNNELLIKELENELLENELNVFSFKTDACKVLYMD